MCVEASDGDIVFLKGSLLPAVLDLEHHCPDRRRGLAGSQFQGLFHRHRL